MKKIIIIGVAILLLAIGAVALFSGLNDRDENKETLPTADPQESYSFVGFTEDNRESTSSDNTTSGDMQTTENNEPERELTKDEILSIAKEAVNKTKDFKGNMTVRHTQTYEIAITEVPGGDAVRKVANGIAESIVKPIDETLKFSNGVAKGSDGETLNMLLPLNKEFELTSEGVRSAEIKQSGSNTLITLTLAEETGTIDTSPKHHSVSVGQMDVTAVDFGVIKMKKFDVNYYSTTITFTINSDGYVINAVYDVPFRVDCIGTLLGYDANVKLAGKQYEIWTITG